MSASVRFQERQADGNGALQRTTSGLGYGLRR